MANLITSAGGQLSVRMANARFARRPIPAIFSGWSKIRVALFTQILDGGINLTGTPRLAVGLCSGDTDIIGDITTNNFVGMISTTVTWTRSSPTVRFGTITFSPATRVGSTLTVGTAFTNSLQFYSSAGSMLFVDIEKGSPNFGITNFGYTSTGAPPVVTEADFLTQSTQSVPVFLNHVHNSTPRTIPVDEGTNGTLDHACVWWDQLASPMDILSWRVYRLA